MSQENVELSYRVIDAFNRRDIAAYLALADPDLELTPYEVRAQGGEPYRGYSGVRSWWEESLAVFPDLRAEVYEIRDFGDRELVHAVVRGQGAASGASIERPVWLVAEWHNGRMVSWCSFESEAEALEAVGLSEQDAHAES